jgi:hypothetical protein
MYKLNTILFILILFQIGTVFARPITYQDKQDLIQYESLQDIEDLLCDLSCDDTLQVQIDSIRDSYEK